PAGGAVLDGVASYRAARGARGDRHVAPACAFRVAARKLPGGHHADVPAEPRASDHTTRPAHLLDGDDGAAVHATRSLRCAAVAVPAGISRRGAGATGGKDGRDDRASGEQSGLHGRLLGGMTGTVPLATP